MAKKTTLIYDFISSYNYKGRDAEVLKLINTYFYNNSDALADGLVNHFISFGNTNRERFYEAYHITEKDYNNFKKNNRNLIKNKALDDLLYLCLFTSYIDTKDKIFLDMIGLVEVGSKFKKFFKYGVSNPAKMKYVLENLSNKFAIKKHGSLFITIQEQISIIVNTPVLKHRFANVKEDENLLYILARISTTINGTMKSISKQFYSTKDDVIYHQSELNTDDGKISLNNNSIMVDNIKTMIDNYDHTFIDHRVLQTLRISSPVKKYLFKKILGDKSKRYFQRISYIYMDYYTATYGNDFADMKKQYIVKSITARMKSNEMYLLEKEMDKDIRRYLAEWQENSDDIDDLTSVASIVALMRNIKYYCIFKTREFMNHLN